MGSARADGIRASRTHPGSWRAGDGDVALWKPVLHEYTGFMTNLTLVIDDDVLQRARVRAVQQGTSVNAAVRAFLDDFADGRTVQSEARRRLVALADHSSASSEGRRTIRDELYD